MAMDLLGYWRAYGPNELHAKLWSRTALLNLLNECTDPTYLPVPERIKDAMQGDAIAQWQVGVALGDLDTEPSDTAMSWIILAALSGYPAAVLATAGELISLAGRLASSTSGFGGFEIEARADICTPARLNRLALEWSRQLGPFLSQRTDFANALGIPRNDSARLAQRAALPTTMTITITDSIGDPGSKDGRMLSVAYQRLTEPMSLVPPQAPLSVIDTVLKQEFPSFAPVIEELMLDLRLRAAGGNPAAKLSPTLLLGRPGIGKTRFARRLGEVIGIGCHLISAAGVSDNRMLSGTARGWSSVQPAFPAIAIRRAGIGNPLLLVDEVEKCRSTHNGSIHASLLNFLEPETARRHFDEALLSACDFSHVSWVLTANSLSTIPDALLSRLRVVNLRDVQPPRDRSMIDRLLLDIAAEYQIDPTQLPEIDSRAQARLSDALARGASIRSIRKVIAGYLARSELPRVIN